VGERGREGEREEEEEKEKMKKRCPRMLLHAQQASIILIAVIKDQSYLFLNFI
jgi:hypothetical protein